MQKLNFRPLSYIALIAVSSVANAQISSDVAITAWGMHYGSQVIYQYQVQNLGPYPIKRFLVGLQHPGNIEGSAELSVIPPSNGTNYWLASNIVGRPDGWGAKLFFPEESEKFALEWIEGGYHKELWPAAPQEQNSPAARNPANVLPPKSTWNTFSVTLKKVDFAYTTGHASVDYGNTLQNVQIQKGDTTAPTLNITANRLNENGNNGNWAIYEIQAIVSDNYDPSPQLVFEPITANQPLDQGAYKIEAKKNSWKVWLKNVSGRVYQLRYVAYDASGNTTSKTIEYSVDSSSKKPSFLK